MIDLKTLYEQTTLYCNLVDTDTLDKYNVEIYHQPDTPIYIFAYWLKDTHNLTSIAFTIKKEKMNNDSRNKLKRNRR